MAGLTKQQQHPHGRLIEVRERLRAYGYTRSHAAAVCDHLTDTQCEAVLNAKDDKAVLAALKPVRVPTGKNSEPEPVSDPDKGEAQRYRAERRKIDEAVAKQYGEETEPAAEE